ncbi:YybH family protein [Pareuzebyella sediminis]|uniref:YybH family protein n=1 Tax=Pareuzebyella sediminis TaxID=2607998 RepID=UPI0018E13F06|nr:DUF4440 domain-containing protein [Pareuzebyella sediminis]
MTKLIKNLIFRTSFVLMPMVIGCTSIGEDATDMATIRTKIEEKEKAFAEAISNQDVEAVLTFYADDAVSMSNGQPADIGREAIRKDLVQSFNNRQKGSVTNFEVLDVFGNASQVTEIGKTTVKDASGKVIYTGKYMAVWEERNGEYICIRDISNGDMPRPPASTKSIHLFDMPKGLTEAQWSDSIKELNTIIADMGYPGAGYAFYKTSDSTIKTNRYYFEGVWPSGDAYKKIHENPLFTEASEKGDSLYAKIKAVEIYRRMEKVD